jgi:hypothetical protein
MYSVANMKLQHCCMLANVLYPHMLCKVCTFQLASLYIYPLSTATYSLVFLFSGSVLTVVI